jgi:hypothetical protein
MFTDDQGAKRETPEEIGIERKLDMILAELKSMQGGFPKNEDGTVDYDGHRHYHEQLIKAKEAETEFWREMKLDIAKKGLWGLLVILCGLILTGLATKLNLQLR